MWRALFLAVGITCCLLGVESLAIEKAVLNVKPKKAIAAELGNKAPRREISPPEWAPWSLMSGGAVVMLYSFTLPRRKKE